MHQLMSNVHVFGLWRILTGDRVGVWLSWWKSIHKSTSLAEMITTAFKHGGSLPVNWHKKQVRKVSEMFWVTSSLFKHTIEFLWSVKLLWQFAVWKNYAKLQNSIISIMWISLWKPILERKDVDLMPQLHATTKLTHFTPAKHLAQAIHWQHELHVMSWLIYSALQLQSPGTQWSIVVAIFTYWIRYATKLFTSELISSHIQWNPVLYAQMCLLQFQWKTSHMTHADFFHYKMVSKNRCKWVLHSDRKFLLLALSQNLQAACDFA